MNSAINHLFKKIRNVALVAIKKWDCSETNVNAVSSSVIPIDFQKNIIVVLTLKVKAKRNYRNKSSKFPIPK